MTMQYSLTKPEEQLPWEQEKKHVRLSDVIVQD